MRLSKDPAQTEAADAFGAAWGSLSEAHKASLMAACTEFDKRRYRASPYYLALMQLVVQGVQSLGNDKTNLDGLMACIQKTALQEPARNWVPFCDRMKFFLVNQALYFNKFYTLRVGPGAYKIEYADQSTDVADTIAATPAEAAPAQQKFDEWNSEPAPVTAEDAALTTSEALQQGPDVVQPGLEGAIIRFTKVDLTLGTGYDSTTIYGTSGVFMLAKNHWVGEGGKFDWTVAGLAPDEAYVELDKYNFRAQIPAFTAENTTLHYPTKLAEPVKGAFEFRSVKHASPEVSRYPRFMSYNAVSAYKNLGEDVELVGGFSLDGRKVNTSAVYLGKSSIAIKHKGQVVYRGISRRYDLGDTAITSLGTYSVLPRGLDSISQAHARLIYTRNPSPQIRLYKNVGQYKEAPFFDSYYRVEITCEALFYNLDSNKIDFWNESNRLRAPVVVESMDYFTTDRYADVQGLNKFSPIGLLANNYTRTNNNERFYADDIAEHYKLNGRQVRGALQSLANEGFIDYDPVSGEGTLGHKLKHYYSSMKKTKDYDFIAIQSVAPERMNARIDLDSNCLFVYGVDRFSLNDSLDVSIKPLNRKIKLYQNRDFSFDGEVQAGPFLVKGEKFNFNYNFYQIDLTKIDSVDVMADKKVKGRQRKKSASRLSGADRNAETTGKPTFTSGVLLINKPDNKSNLQNLPQYPVFDIQAPSYIYFDKPTVLKGAYDKRVFFYVPPFKVDSISGPNLAAISFNGTFHSDGIFPEFEEKLEIQPDKTMGFNHSTPAEGYNLYGKGPAKFFGDISLNGKGIRGKGEIKYLTTTVKSDDFIFYQDSVIAKGPTVRMEKGTYGDSAAYPDAYAQDFAMKWSTKQDTMYLTNVGKTPWYFYGKRVRMNGTLAINETGAYGYGLIKAAGSRAESPAYSFKHDRITGRNAFFEVQSANPVKPAFACKNVKFDFYVDDEYATFSPEVEGEASNEFPYARYKTSIPKATWDLKKKTVTMNKPEDAELSSSIFYSTLPEQDSLNFMATGAVYDIANNKLAISGVPFIYVADGMVIPDSGRVEILENAEMTPLKKSVLILDTINKYHRLIDASITVKSRYAFEGEATYLYVNTVNDTLKIKFDKFEFITEKEGKNGGDPILHTKSGGEIMEDAPLKIADGVLFKGTATMWANRPTLEFQGFVKLDLRKTDTEWLKYESTGESKEFVLDLKNAADADGNPVTTGLFIEDGAANLYGVFVNGKRTSADQEVFAVTGVMNFNSETKEFRVGSAERLAEKTTEGNIFAYNDSTGRTSFEGKLNFLRNNTSDFNIKAAGTGAGLMDSADFDINAVLALQMSLPTKAWASMTKTAQQRIKDLGLPEAMGDRGLFGQRVIDLFGKNVGDAFRKGGNKPVHELVPKLAKGVTFTDLGLKWNKKYAAFYTPLKEGDEMFAKLNILNILNTNLNAQLNGYLEIKKADGLDIISLYIEASPDAWWFITFDDQQRLAATSSVAEFTDAVQEKSKGVKPGSFYLEATDEQEKNQFLKHFRQDYLGMKVNDADYETKPKEEAEPAEGEEEEKPKDEVASDDTDENPDASTDDGKDKKGKKGKKKKKQDDQTEAPAAEDAGADDGFGGSDESKPAKEKPADEEESEETAKPDTDSTAGTDSTLTEPAKPAEEKPKEVEEPKQDEKPAEESKPEPAAEEKQEEKTDGKPAETTPAEGDAGFGAEEEKPVDTPKKEDSKDEKPKKKEKDKKKEEPKKDEKPAEGDKKDEEKKEEGEGF